MLPPNTGTGKDSALLPLAWLSGRSAPVPVRFPLESAPETPRGSFRAPCAGALLIPRGDPGRFFIVRRLMLQTSFARRRRSATGSSSLAPLEVSDTAKSGPSECFLRHSLGRL